MDISGRTAVLRALENFAGNYRMANGEQERARSIYLAHEFIDTMTFDEIERQDFREIYRNKIGIRDLAAISTSVQ